MRQAPVPPGKECSIPEASEPGEKRKPVRTISPAELEGLEQAPFFEALCKLLVLAALRARARRAQATQDTQPNEVA
jgi:hypothetical protein